MIPLHCTRKLLARLPLTEEGLLTGHTHDHICTGDGGSSLPGEWYAHLITLQRRQCVLFVHEETRFPLFVPAVKKADFAVLDWWFQDCFMNTLLQVGATPQQLKAAERLLALLHCDFIANPSAQGSLRQMKMRLEWMLARDELPVAELSPYYTAAWLADVPCKVKGKKEHLWPILEMLALLDDFVD